MTLPDGAAAVFILSTSGVQALRSLVEHGNAIDLDVDTGAVRRAAGAGAGHLLAGHVLAERFVEAREIGRVAQDHSHIDDVLRRSAGGLEYFHQIVERL